MQSTGDRPLSFAEPGEELVHLASVEKQEEAKGPTQFFLESPLVACVYGFAKGGAADIGADYLESMQAIISAASVTHVSVAACIREVVERVYDVTEGDRLGRLLPVLAQALHEDLWSIERNLLSSFTTIFSRYSIIKESFSATVIRAVDVWLEFFIASGFDIQRLVIEHYESDRVQKALKVAKERQLDSWSQFDPIKNGENFLKTELWPWRTVTGAEGCARTSQPPTIAQTSSHGLWRKRACRLVDEMHAVAMCCGAPGLVGQLQSQPGSKKSAQGEKYNTFSFVGCEWLLHGVRGRTCSGRSLPSRPFTGPTL